MTEKRHLPISDSTDSLPELISQNIDLVVALHANEERKTSNHERWVGRITHFFGRPGFLYFIILVVLLWTLPNVAPKKWKLPQFDPPPFSQLGFVLTFSSLLVTAGVLVQQDRQERLAEQRAQLSLQLSLLSEQKIAKLIALVEELRRDLPNVHDRMDVEAETMQQVADPHQVLDVLKEALNEELTETQR
jgi:uncharacterized membrane protein